ncbi:ADP-ribosylation factor 6-like isoform X1 [Clavelina lepadiformis]|uniref:ADP-ribosylation factor 6-like isoform X1 n=1 Tax=Clavelina lepadiformis TaxID=159417 RepID=UPI004041974D
MSCEQVEARLLSEVIIMGQLMSNISECFQIKPKNVIMFGCNQPGKTTILYKLVSNQVVNTIPTVGFNVETLVVQNQSLRLWDVGGGSKMPKVWPQYFDFAHGVIYVIDCSDEEYFEYGLSELVQLIDRTSDMELIPFLIFANKQDKPDPIASSRINDKLLEVKCRYQWHLQPCSATTGQGLSEGIKILTEMINQSR